MDRNEFEALRDLPGKTIAEDIVLQETKDNHPLYTARVTIRNDIGIDARLQITWNYETDAKSLNVWIPGVGPICRLDVDGPPHKPYGRCHKHSLKLPDCSSNVINLSRDIIDRNDLSSKSIKEVFTDFCQKACIEHHGEFHVPCP